MIVETTNTLLLYSTSRR